MNRFLITTGAAVALASMAAACAPSRPLYGVGQAWQRNECFKINDAEERRRCLASASSSYEEYQREAQQAAQPR